ncbi:hypothetical protein VTO73DRAFT_13203 [Trametes versicolor]
MHYIPHKDYSCLDSRPPLPTSTTSSSMEVDDETYKVFASIFLIGRDRKGTLAWGDFAMTKVGFTYHSLKGSKRQFQPKSPSPPLPWDKPHGKKKGVIMCDVKGRLATKLGRLYGWDADSFIPQE